MDTKGKGNEHVDTLGGGRKGWEDIILDGTLER